LCSMNDRFLAATPFTGVGQEWLLMVRDLPFDHADVNDRLQWPIARTPRSGFGRSAE
jgi:hypothetical protein